MPLPFRVGVFLLLPFAVAPAAADVPWRLPPVVGDLAAELELASVPGAPVLQARLTAGVPAPGRRRAELALTGEGTAITVELDLDAAGRGTWRVAGARLDLAAWSVAAARRLGAEFAGATVGGVLEFDGDGTLGGDDGWTGRGVFRLRDGRIDHAADGVVVEGLGLNLVIDDLAARRSAPAQSLTWRGGRYDPVPFGRGHVEFTLVGDRVEVGEASLEVFGGEIVLGAFAFSTLSRDFAVVARIIGVELTQVLPLLPPVLATAEGQVDGLVTLSRTPAGLAIGTGRLALRSGRTAEVRLTPTPGLISGTLPPKVLEHYPGLGGIEAGRIPIRAEVFELAFTPGGDAQGRTASVRLAGGPFDPALRAPIDLTVNVTGPLESLLKFGTHSRLKFGTSR